MISSVRRCRPAVKPRHELLPTINPVVVPRQQIVNGPDLLSQIGAVAAQIGKQVGEVGGPEVTAIHQA